jgi:hypothetical protein
MNGSDWNRFSSNVTSSIPWNFTQVNADPCSDNWQGASCEKLIPTVWTITNIQLADHHISEVMFAIIKLFLNNNLIWKLIPYFKQRLWLLYQDFYVDKIDPRLEIAVEKGQILEEFTAMDVQFHSNTITLNNIIFPAMAIMIVSSECIL